MDGQLRVKTEEGKGARFVIQLPFDLPTKDSLKKPETAANITTNCSTATAISAVLPADFDERMLVNCGSSTLMEVPTLTTTERMSFDETNSISSIRSGTSKGSGRSNKSDADRLIDAIQTPLSLGGPDGPSAHLRHHYSKERHHGASDSATPSYLPDTSGSPVSKFSPRASSKRLEGIQQSSGRTGVHYITDTRTPIRPVKVPDELLDQPAIPHATQSSKVLFEIPNGPKHGTQKPPGQASRKLRVLIAEDDPINMKILTRRLEKAGQ